PVWPSGSRKGGRLPRRSHSAPAAAPSAPLGAALTRRASSRQPKGNEVGPQPTPGLTGGRVANGGPRLPRGSRTRHDRTVAPSGTGSSRLRSGKQTKIPVKNLMVYLLAFW